MAFGGSGFFTNTLKDILENTTAFDWSAGTPTIALFPNTITPDFTVASAASAYDSGVWTAAAELSDPADWPVGGVALASPTVTAESPAAGQVKLDADNVSQANTTLVDVRGGLIYMGDLAAPVADQGLLAVDFGSLFNTTNGTFAITWDALGVAYFDIW